MNRRGRGMVRKERPEPAFVVGNWGETDNPQGVCRRVWVSKYPRSTTMEDLRKFFGHESIEGISMNPKGFAFIQFKRPRDFSKALDRNKSEFKRHCISIEPYKERPKPAPRPAIEPPVPLDRWMAIRDRSRSKSLDRSRSSSPQRGGGRDSSEGDPLENRVNPNEDSGIFNFNQHFNPNQVPPMAGFAQSGLIRQPYVQYNPQILAQNQLILPNNGAYRPPVMCYGALPADVGLTIQLVLQQGTARNLSVNQCDKLIEFFAHEKLVIQENQQRANGENLMRSGVSMNSLNSQHVLQQKPSSDIPVNQPNQKGADNPSTKSPNSDDQHEANNDDASQDGSDVEDTDRRHEEAMAAIQQALTR